MNKINICIPTYHRAKSLKKLLDQILLNIDYFNVYVVSDTKTDKEFKKIVKEYDKHKEIKFFEKQNGGVSSSRNYLINKVKSGHILFIDDDDVIDENLWKWVRDNEDWTSPVQKFIMTSLHTNGKITKTQYPLSRKNLSRFDKFASAHVSTYMIKKEWYVNKKIKFFEGVLSEDAFVWALIYENAPKIPLHKKIVTVNQNDVEGGRERLSDDIESFVLSWKNLIKIARKKSSDLLWSRIFLNLSLVLDKDIQQSWSPEAKKILKTILNELKTRKWKILKALPWADKFANFWKIFRKRKILKNY